MIIAIDFDGTIVEHMYPKVGNAVPEALTWIREFQEEGCKIILWTMRGLDDLKDAVEYLELNGIKLFGINSNPEQGNWTISPKAYAHMYIDDAAIGCPLIPGKFGPRPMVDWTKVGPEVMKRIQPLGG